MKSLSIGSIKLKNRLFLAPMVDVTDAAYRLLCREQGAAMAYTEMLYVDAVLHENKPTLQLMKIGGKGDRPLGIQVTGNTVNEFKKLAQLAVLRNYDLVDINCGCPSVKIVGNQAGSYLLRTPDKIGEMITILKDSGLTVTAKIRLGYSNNTVMDVAKTVEKAGADLLTIHARTAMQKARDPPDWSWISKVKKDIGIPVVGNGGIVDGKSAAAMLDTTDGAMIASAAIGNPFIFRNILHYLKTGREQETTPQERIEAFTQYLSLAKKHDVLDMSRVKHLGSSFLSGFAGASKARAQLMTLKTVEDIEGFATGLHQKVL